VTAWRGGASHSVLFDTGPESDVLLRNVARLGVDLASIEAIVLSHGHFDHVGALTEALDAIRARNGAAKIPVYVHPGMFRTRAQQMPDGACDGVLANTDGRFSSPISTYVEFANQTAERMHI
jgi:7,8-dihydropterin-6-yl-methyl-4-(beta-D-ribofuranosyl)aminobenzene 5'-phosphate synthase